MFIKWLFIILLTIFVIKYIYKPAKKSFNQATSSKEKFAGAPKQIATQTLKACPCCGTYFNESQGVSQGGEIYCCGPCGEKGAKNT